MFVHFKTSSEIHGIFCMVIYSYNILIPGGTHAVINMHLTTQNPSLCSIVTQYHISYGNTRQLWVQHFMCQDKYWWFFVDIYLCVWPRLLCPMSYTLPWVWFTTECKHCKCTDTCKIYYVSTKNKILGTGINQQSMFLMISEHHYIV